MDRWKDEMIRTDWYIVQPSFMYIHTGICQNDQKKRNKSEKKKKQKLETKRKGIKYWTCYNITLESDSFYLYSCPHLDLCPMFSIELHSLPCILTYVL